MTNSLKGEEPSHTQDRKDGQGRKALVSKSKDGHFKHDIHIPLLYLYNPLHFIKSSPKHLGIKLPDKNDYYFYHNYEKIEVQGV